MQLMQETGLAQPPVPMNAKHVGRLTAGDDIAQFLNELLPPQLVHEHRFVVVQLKLGHVPNPHSAALRVLSLDVFQSRSTMIPEIRKHGTADRGTPVLVVKAMFVPNQIPLKRLVASGVKLGARGGRSGPDHVVLCWRGAGHLIAPTSQRSHQLQAGTVPA